MKKNFTKQFAAQFNLNNQKEADLYHFLSILDKETFFRLIEESSMYHEYSDELFNIVDCINKSSRQLKLDLTN